MNHYQRTKHGKKKIYTLEDLELLLKIITKDKDDLIDMTNKLDEGLTLENCLIGRLERID